MRKMIIDTDTGSDDAVAIIMGLKSTEVKIEAVTTVFGNVPLDLGTLNALMTIEITDGQKPPVYIGADRPLMRDPVDACFVHGEDGMGDCDLIHPTLKAETKHAVDAILDIVKANPHEIEIMTIGPVTNIALAILKEPETMKQVKHIWSMGSGGIQMVGNVNPIACFNVFTDAEAHHIMLESGIKTTIIGFDVCLGDSAWNKEDMDALLKSGKKEAEFAVKCNRTLLDYNININGGHFVDLPDAVAMGVALWDDMVIESKLFYCYTCLHEEATYGQLVLYDNIEYLYAKPYMGKKPNATVIKTVDSKLYKQRLHDLLVK